MACLFPVLFFAVFRLVLLTFAHFLQVTIAVEFPPTGAEDEGNPRAYYAEQV